MNYFLRHISVLYISVLLFNGFNSVSQKLSSGQNGFIENKGQIVDQKNVLNKDVLFLYSGKGIKIQLRTTGYSYELFKFNGLPKIKAGKKIPENISDLNKTTVNICRVDMDFFGMNATPEIIAEEKNQNYLNYYLNGKEVVNVSSYNKVTYKNVFPNTDIEFVLSDNSSSPFKYNIILHPGADITKVKLLCKGASSIIKTNNGFIDLSTPLGIINETIPFSYYTHSPTENKKVNFKLLNNTISFEANYDNTKTFVIDPSTNRIWGTYYGDTGLDFCTSNGSDASGGVYIAGYTTSTSNMATAGVYQTTLNASYEAYVAKFDASGSRVWGTYFGGASYDIFYALFIDPNGTIYAAGDTNSPANIASIGAHQTTYGGGIDDATLVKFNTNGQLQWATYYGGLMHDIASAVTMDNAGDIIITGHTESANVSNIIATPGAYATSYTFNYDVFIAKFNNLGVRQWGTYYGDTGADEAYGIDCDASNNIYITGFTESLFGISTGGSHQGTIGGNQDAFVAKFNSTGSTLVWGTYYGGATNDGGTVLEIDNSGNIYVGGNTTSPTNIASIGAHQTSLGSSDDGFVAKFTSGGVRQWGTYFGGNDVDYISDLVLDGNNYFLFCGETESTNSISTSGAYQISLATINNYDSYFEKFTSAGTRKLGTYFGGSSNDNARAITLNNTGKVYLAGETTSTNSIASGGAFMTTASTNGDAFLAKFCVAPQPSLTPAGTTTLCLFNTTTLTATNGFPTYTWTGGSTTNPLITSTATPAGTYTFAVNVSDGFGCTGISDTATVIVNVCVGINELENNLSANLYPIPSSDLIYLKLNNVFIGETTRIEIYSSLGQLVTANETKENLFISDIKNFSPGIYFMRIKFKERILDKKFIKQ